MKNLIFFLILMIPAFGLLAQEETINDRKKIKDERMTFRKEQVKNLVDNKAFVFNARYAVPLAGESVNLDYSYVVKIDGDEILSYLPFYGVAYEAEYGMQDSPFDFTETLKNYTVEREENNYIIRFQVTNSNDQINYYFRISELGYTYLKVTSAHRQCISFRGVIEEIENNIF